MLMGKPAEALPLYQTAASLAPADAYPLYNRGRAQLALGNKEAARADFTAAADPKFNQPKARKLALTALGELE
jgi:Flp pilus assembly protein TadD